MTRTTSKRLLHEGDISSASAHRADLRPINPSDIQVSESVLPDTNETQKIIEIIKTGGNLPEIIVTPSNQLVSGINALEAAKTIGQSLILVSVQNVEPETSKLQLDYIKLDGGTQSRTGINQHVVDEYAIAWKENNNFPPVIVFYDGTSYWLADGFHRCISAQQAKLTEINADIRQGTRREAVLYSVGANSNHGLRRTNDDKRRAVTTLLQDEEWAVWSDREIARRTGVHHDTVGRIRTELSGGFRQIEQRKVERGGSTYTQKAKKDKPWNPRETEVVEIIGGEFKGRMAEVRVLSGNMAMCHVEGEGENTRHNIRLSDMKAIEKEEPATSLKQEIKQQQEDLGLGKREQIMPDIPRNMGHAPQEHQQASAVNLAANGDAIVGEVAIALLRLSPKQMHEVMSKFGHDATHPQLESIWKALEVHFAHKVAA